MATTTLSPSTITTPSVFRPTTTSTPKPVKTTVTITQATVTRTTWSLDIDQVIVTSTATCVTPTKQTKPDPKCTITPTLVSAKALETGKKVRYIKDRRVPLDKTQRIKERKERLGLMQKRAPGRPKDECRWSQAYEIFISDAPTATVTDMNTSDYITITSTSTAAATTITIVCTNR